MSNYTALLSKSHTFYAEQAGFDRPNMPPSWVMDRLAEESLTGKYDVTPGNICTTCHTARSVCGDCFCTD